MMRPIEVWACMMRGPREVPNLQVCMCPGEVGDDSGDEDAIVLPQGPELLPDLLSLRGCAISLLTGLAALCRRSLKLGVEVVNLARPRSKGVQALEVQRPRDRYK